MLRMHRYVYVFRVYLSLIWWKDIMMCNGTCVPVIYDLFICTKVFLFAFLMFFNQICFFFSISGVHFLSVTIGFFCLFFHYFNILRDGIIKRLCRLCNEIMHPFKYLLYAQRCYCNTFRSLLVVVDAIIVLCRLIDGNKLALYLHCTDNYFWDWVDCKNK